MRTIDRGTYEMLWDCEACGTKRLLARSNRHCPLCGSPQDPARRSFPEPGEEVAVANHAFEGADRECPACATPMGARAKNCRGCGSDLDAAKEVGRRPDAIVGRDFPSDAPRAPRAAAGKGCLVGVAVVLVLLGAVAAFFLWKRPVSVEVAGHRWEREIAIERLDPTSGSDWCDRMPGDAYDVRRSREVREHEKVPDGEECRTKNVDQGDGTFKRIEECRPKYREKPVYEDKCRYVVDRWKTARAETARGEGLSSTPQWPAVRLQRAGACRGCEREGARTARYLVDLKGSDGSWSCDVGEARWRRFPLGARVEMKVRVVDGGADCASLQPPA